jgi:hypothetical protein
MEVNKNELPKNSEQWAAIDGYKNYQVSWWGRVRNSKTARILRGRVCSHGYMSVNLSKKGKVTTHTIHKLVAQEWVSNPGKKRCVDHVDGCKTNNHYENLRWATYAENNRNRKKQANTTSIYKGVSFDKNSGKWLARIMVDGTAKCLGAFEIERGAAEAYNASAAEFYKEFARLNEFDDCDL